MTDTLVDRYRYSANYIPDYPKFLETVMNKTVIPYQIEMQPGPEKGNLCWLKCPYCYGVSAEDTGERMEKKRWGEILKEAADGGVKKVIFAGYCTDPLNYEYIEELLAVAIQRKMVFGFNTKALSVRSPLLTLLGKKSVMPSSYFNVSVDAGNNESYNRIHGISGAAKHYDRILRNILDISSYSNIDISASYLIMKGNNGPNEVLRFISDFRAAGCKVIRFTFLQPPKGKSIDIPTGGECGLYMKKLLPVIQEQDSDSCRVIMVDTDREYDLYGKARTLPCLARWVFPTVGFDGWLYHCSQSAAPNFGKMALGDLKKRGFWDIFYDYDVHSMTEAEKMMKKLGCRCDRKAHLLNGRGENNP